MALRYLRNNLKERIRGGGKKGSDRAERRARRDEVSKGKVGKEEGGEAGLCKYAVLNFSNSRPSVPIPSYNT